MSPTAIRSRPSTPRRCGEGHHPRYPADAHGFWIDEKEGKLAVSLTKPSQVGVIDLAKNEVVQKFPFSSGCGE